MTFSLPIPLTLPLFLCTFRSSKFLEFSKAKWERKWLRVDFYLEMWRQSKLGWNKTEDTEEYTLGITHFMSKVWQVLSNYTKKCIHLLIVTVLDNENRRILFRVADQLEIPSKYRYLARCCGSEIILGIRSENVIKKIFLYSCHLYSPKRALGLQAFLKFQNKENYQSIPTHLLKLESSQHQ